MGAEEEEIINWVKEMARIGFAVNCGLLLDTGHRLSKVARSNGTLGVGKISSADKWVRLSSFLISENGALPHVM